MTKVELIRIIAALAWKYESAEIWSSNNRLDKVVHRIQHPRRGDIVCETSSSYFMPAQRRVGIFLGTHIHQGIKIWNIRRLDTGKIEKWDNCRFIKVFQDKEQK